MKQVKFLIRLQPGSRGVVLHYEVHDLQNVLDHSRMTLSEK
jgi:hypothetical protein